MSEKPARHIPIFLVLFFVIALLGATAVYTGLQMFNSLNSFTLSRREAIAFLIATVMQEKLDRTIDVGTSLASRVQFRTLIHSGKWDDAFKIIESTTSLFPYIDRISLFDPAGNLKATTQPVSPDIQALIGANFAYRDYYQGVSKQWKPYVGEAIKPAANLGYNLVPVAIPIKSESDESLGFLLLVIRLDTVSAWSRVIDLGFGGFIYIVDQKGHLVAHPILISEKEVVDFSNVPTVQKVLKGEHGIAILPDPNTHEEFINAYAPVPEYGWGVVVVQPTRTAFVERNRLIGRIIVIWLFVISMVGFFTYRLLRDRAMLKAQRDRERTMLNSIGDGVVAISRDWHITLWNKAATQITGWTQAEALGKPFRDIVKFLGEADRKENIVFIEEAMLYQKTHFMENHTLLTRKDGTDLSVGDSASPVFDPNGNVVGVVIIFRDLSHERQLEKSREDFASLATHQLRAPLTGINGYSSMLLDGDMGALNKKQKNAVDQISQATGRLLTLVNSLLNASRIELGTIAIEPEPIYLPEIADAVIAELEPQIETKKLIFQKKYDPMLPSVNVDPKLTRAIIQNLLTNAINYTPEHGNIALSIQKRAEQIVIEMRDTGYGIPQEQQANIFKKMFRADNVREKKIEGTGLGLYIVKSILDQAGGKIWFESEENKGTTFYISIPASGMKKKEGAKGLS